MMEIRVAIILFLSAALLSCDRHDPQAASSPSASPEKTIGTGEASPPPDKNSNSKGPLDILLKELDTSSSGTTKIEVNRDGIENGVASRGSDSPATPSQQPSPLSSPAEQTRLAGDLPLPPSPESQTLAEPMADSLTLSGDMHIDFGSRLIKDGTDIYSLDLVCADSIRIKGKILREASLVSSVLIQEKKPIEFQYYLDLYLINPTNHSREQQAGKIKGSIMFSGDADYNTEGLSLQSLLPASLAPLSGGYSGTLSVKDKENEGVIGATYTRVVSNRQVSLNVSNIDPVKFEDIILAGGPTEEYPETQMSGSFDYDYDTGNWITSGITFNHEGAAPDKIAGSIKWNSDPDREHNGKGQYEFNLRFNEELYNAALGTPSAINSAIYEPDFFMAEARIPTLRGVIKFRDSFRGRDEHGQPLVTKSDIQYELVGSKLTKQQLLSFLKMWLIMVGPVNDQ